MASVWVLNTELSKCELPFPSPEECSARLAGVPLPAPSSSSDLAPEGEASQSAAYGEHLSP